jgi:hypothetical protein
LKKVAGVFSPRLNKNHIVFYEALSHLFHHKGVEVVFFIDKWFEDKVKLSGKDKFIYNTFRHEFLFYIKQFYKLRKCDYVIIEPDSSKILLASFVILFRLDFTLVVHNANYWLNPTEISGLREYVIIYLNNILFNRAKSLIVVNSNVKKFCLDHTSKKVYYFPFNLYLTIGDKLINQNTDSIINLVVPGNVSSNRRDYITILEGFEYALKSRRDLRLVLLGKVDINDRFLLEKIQGLKIKFPLNILFWNDFIDDKEFEFYIETSTLFIAPLNQYIKTDISIEEYGITKETGVTSFIRKNNKYCLAPNYLVFEEDLHHLIIKYRDSFDFAGLLCDLIYDDVSKVQSKTDDTYMSFVENEVDMYLKENY